MNTKDLVKAAKAEMGGLLELMPKVAAALNRLLSVEEELFEAHREIKNLKAAANAERDRRTWPMPWECKKYHLKASEESSNRKDGR